MQRILRLLIAVSIIFGSLNLYSKELADQKPIDQGRLSQKSQKSQKVPTTENTVYQIAVGDQLNIYVWRNPELSITVPVRPDGRISLPLVDDILVTDKTPVQLAFEIEKILSKFIRQPNVSVIVVGFGETLQSSIKVIGGGLKPTAIPYSKGIHLLDVIIKMGGVPETASVGEVKVIRRIKGSDLTEELKVDLGRLIDKGDISQNLKMQRGDILIITEKWF